MAMIGGVVNRFVRNPNFDSSIWNRFMNRGSPHANTLTVLEDPANQRKLFLIGTTNSSTFLAKRTRNLIRAERPDSLLVQTNQDWWNTVKQLEGVHTQADLNEYNELLLSANKYQIDNNPRGAIFRFRLYSWLLVMSAMKRFPRDFHPFVPGLEMKWAIEEAENLKIPVEFAGLQLNPETLNALQLEKRGYDLIPLVYRCMRSLHNSHWRREKQDHYALLEVLGGEAFAEVIDKYRICWFSKHFERISPRQKQIVVNDRNVDLFHRIYRNLPGKKLVAVVNQWHVPGIEAHWRHTTGTELQGEPINPIGDMDIEKYMEDQLVNEALRDFVSKLTKSEPATWQNYLTMYHKETMEAERTRHVTFLGANDPHLTHDGKLYHYMATPHDLVSTHGTQDLDSATDSRAKKQQQKH